MSQLPESKESYSRFENTVILVALLLGFVGSVLLYLINVKPILVSIFLGTGIASLIYRFLGGTTGNTMQLGALKLTGTVAVLIGSAYFINKELARQEEESIPNEVTMQPNPDNWIALNFDGSPVQIEIEETNQIIEKHQKSPWINLPLEIESGDEDKFKVLGPDRFVLGVLEPSTIRKANLYGTMEKSDLYIVTPRLKPFSNNYDLDPIPYKLNTLKYSGDYSRFQLTDYNDSIVWSGSLYRKRFEIIELGNRSYFVAVVEVNHDFFEQDSMYAKFAFAEILKK